MEWIVNIEGFEKSRRIKIIFDPINEKIHLYGEFRPKNKMWNVFSEITHPMKVNLEKLQNLMSQTIDTMDRRVSEYENLAEGFTVLKWIAIDEE